MIDLVANHLCAHPDCKLWIPASRFACRAHWRQLPRALRNDINRCFSAYEIEQAREQLEQLRAVQGSAIEFFQTAE